MKRDADKEERQKVFDYGKEFELCPARTVSDHFETRFFFSILKDHLPLPLVLDPSLLNYFKYV